jgi:hypothetical protein
VSDRRKLRHVSGAKDAPPPEIVSTAERAECPDCDSDVTIYRQAGNWRVSVAHDHECPQLAWRERTGNRTQLAIVSQDGRPLDPGTVAATLGQVLEAGPALVRFVRPGESFAPGWQAREAAERFAADQDGES